MARTRLSWPSALLALAACGHAVAQDATSLSENATVREEAQRKQRGVSWVAGREVGEEHFRSLAETHVEWIVQTPFFWMKRFDSPRVVLHTGGGVFWGETDAGLAATTALAKERGMGTLLKPHIWLKDQSDGKWRGEIAMSSDADWRAWFESYREGILHYARFAEEHGIEALCVGTELHRTVVDRPDDWHRVIEEVRQVYGGKLTYAANWYEEFEAVPFWDELDYIGVQAYFPLAEEEGSTVEQLRRGWSPFRDRLERLSKRVHRPVLFTEIGYRSVSYAAIRPWEWPQRAGGPKPSDLDTQARCYTAFFETFWHEPWFAGAYWWKWFPTRLAEGRGENDDFTPQFKPAQAVLADWYGREDP